jgi:hypothetical protein
MAIRFHYKGLSAEDRVFPLTPEVSVAKAKGTLYEAWFDTLKTSPWYRELCETGVFLSPSAEEAWSHFGDLRQVTFQEWWLSTGYRIFAEKIDYRPIEVIGVTTKVKNVDSAKKPPTLIIEVPLNLAPAALREQFDQILRQHAEYLGDFDRWDHSTAPVHQHRESKLNYKTIRQWLDVYEAYEKGSGKAGFKLYNFASDMQLHPLFNRKEFRGRDVPEDLRVKMANVASDVLKSVRALMANATEMRFPDTSAHPWATSSSRSRPGRK